MSEQYENLNEKTKMVDIALRYTSGNIEKAKDMVAGNYIDNIIIKGKFLVKSANQSGLFFAYFNYIDEYIANVSSVISSRTSMFEKVRIFDNWKTLYKDLLAYRENADAIDTQNFNYFLIDSFISYDVFPDVQERNLDELTRTITEIIAKSFNSPSAVCQIEFDTASSLEMSLAGVQIDLPGTEEQADSRESSAIPLSPEEERIQKIEEEANYIVEGKAILSPIKGTTLTELNPGDRIRIELTGSDLVTDKILRVLNAYAEGGGRTPVIGRLKAILPMGKDGFILYAFVAKGVLAKIYEEQANVRILVEKTESEAVTEAASIDNRILILMLVVVGLIIVAGVILLSLL